MRIKKPKQRTLPDDVIKYQSGNETIIQPIGEREKQNTTTLLNIGVGLLIGVAATYFLLVPARIKSANLTVQQELKSVSEQLDKKTSDIKDLTQQVKDLKEAKDKLQSNLDSYEGNQGTLEAYNALFTAADAYIEDPGNVDAVADAIGKIDASTVTSIESEEFKTLYQKIMTTVGPSIAEKYYKAGMDLYQKKSYDDAIDNFTKAISFDAKNENAYYNLGNAYKEKGDKQSAIEAYTKVVDNFGSTEKAKKAQEFIEELQAE